MNVAIYCRVSTDEQKLNGLSIETQLNELREYAKQHNYSIYKEYIDAGFSGGLLNRPALNELLSDVKLNKFKIVLFVKLDRWFRSVAHYYKIQEILESNKVEWIATQENYETITSSGKFKVNIMLSVSQQFKDATSERIKSVFKYKRQVAKTAVGGPFYGYNVINKKYVINEEEANNLRLLYQKYLELCSMDKCYKWWNKNIGYITHDMILSRLQNQKYNGIYKYKDEPIIYDYYPKIIDDDTFNKVQDLVQKRSKIYRDIRGHKKTFLFSGLIYCSECNGRMSGATYPSGTKNYVCRKYKSTRECINNHSNMEHIIEKELFNQLPFLLEEVKIKAKQKNNEVNKKSNLPQLKDKLKRLQDIYINGLIDLEDYKIKYNDIQNQINIETQSETSKRMVLRDEIINLDKIDYKTMIESLDEENKQILYKKIINKIEIAKDGNIKFDLKLY